MLLTHIKCPDLRQVIISRMKTRRLFIKALGAALLLPLVARGAKSEELTIYRAPGCNCCGKWEDHMRANGFHLQSQTVGDINSVKRKYGVRQELASCHTAVIGGYVIEGHVPAADVTRLLRERPSALGLAVPGMPASAPGMDRRPAKPYDTIAFDANRSWLFERH